MKKPPAKGHIKNQLRSVDNVIGGNVRLLRQASGLTLPKLADHLNLSYQQVQKYETGANRVSCSTLYVIADHLKLSPLAFFSGLPLHDKTQLLTPDQMAQLSWRHMEILQLIQNLDRDAKAALISLLRALQ